VSNLIHTALAGLGLKVTSLTDGNIGAIDDK